MVRPEMISRRAGRPQSPASAGHHRGRHFRRERDPDLPRPDGWWKTYKPEELATREAFNRDPVEVWRWYEMRRAIVARLQLCLN